MAPSFTIQRVIKQSNVISAMASPPVQMPVPRQLLNMLRWRRQIGWAISQHCVPKPTWLDLAQGDRGLYGVETTYYCGRGYRWAERHHDHPRDRSWRLGDRAGVGGTAILTDGTALLSGARHHGIARVYSQSLAAGAVESDTSAGPSRGEPRHPGAAVDPGQRDGHGVRRPAHCHRFLGCASSRVRSR